MPSFIFMIGIILLIFIVTVGSSYHVYTYDDGKGDDEHCCLVRLGDNFCLAKPLTRSLIQVNKECQRLNANEKNKNYLNKIVRRLNVQTSTTIGDKILLQLKEPLEDDILDNDLLCLAAAHNNLDLENCFVELAEDKPKKNKGKGKNATIFDEEESDDENEPRRVKVNEPVKIREGHGLSVRQTYELNLTDFRATTSQQRECWSWYRKNTKDILYHPITFKKSCIPLTNQREKCLQQLFYTKSKVGHQQSYSTSSIEIGSKLYCENNNQETKLLGYHRRSEICFTTHYQIYIEHKFTDFVSLSDINKNEDVLQFILNNTKLTKEFQEDCEDTTTLVDLTKTVDEDEEKDE